MANVGNLVDRDSQYIAILWACPGKFANTGVFYVLFKCKKYLFAKFPDSLLVNPCPFIR